MTGGKSPLSTQHYSREHASAVGTNGYVNGRRDYFASCGCGWLETGWPTEAIARRSLDGHILKAHPESAVAYKVRS